ncbi:MAG: hypothetical protein ACRD2E_10700 [Terriglobales bacterium]
MLLTLLSAPTARAQGLGIDRWFAGIEQVHDHATIAFQQPALNDPYPHLVREGYAFDGADLILGLRWHWDRGHWLTRVRVTPAARPHWAYDEDTDFRPGDQFTHGDEGYARSRTFGISQQFPAWHLGGSARPGGGWGSLAFRLGLERQFTRYHAVTTYNLNSNPALASMSFQRLISERAVLYELRSTAHWQRRWRRGRLRYRGTLGITPLAGVWLRNYIPVVEATSQTQAYGFRAALNAGLRFGHAAAWGLRLGASADWENGYNPQKYFRREVFALRLQLSGP